MVGAGPRLSLSLSTQVVFIDLDVLVMRNLDELLRVPRPIDFSAAPACVQYNGEAFVNGGVFRFRPDLATAVRMTQVRRLLLYPWRGFMPNGAWGHVCAPHDGCAHASCLAAQRLFPNATNPFLACRLAHKGSFNPGGRILPKCEPSYTDQTIFNEVFRRNRKRTAEMLPPRFNWALKSRFQNESACALAPHLQGLCPFNVPNDTAIVHFMGHPKPWAKPSQRTAKGSTSQAKGAVGNRLWRERCAESIGSRWQQSFS